MKKILLIIFGLYTMLSYSQDNSDAELLLNKVSENIKNYENIYINYAYTLKNIEEDINQTNNGSFVTEDEKWRFEMLGVTRIFDGNKLYSISPDDQEVTISSQDPEDETTITPNKMLYFYEEGYYFEMDESRFVGNGQFRKKIQYVDVEEPLNVKVKLFEEPTIIYFGSNFFVERVENFEKVYGPIPVSYTHLTLPTKA